MLTEKELEELEPICQEIAELADEHSDSVCIDQLIDGWRASVEVNGEILYCSEFFPIPKEALGNLKNKIPRGEVYSPNPDLVKTVNQ